MAKRNPPAGLPPIHPGEYLKDVILPALEISTSAFADHVGLGRQTLYDLMNGRIGVTAATALRLGKATGMRPQMWLSLQALHDLKVAEAAIGDQVAAIGRLPEKAAAEGRAEVRSKLAGVGGAIVSAAGHAAGTSSAKARGAGVIEGGKSSRFYAAHLPAQRTDTGEFVQRKPARSSAGVIRETVKTPNRKA